MPKRPLQEARGQAGEHIITLQATGKSAGFAINSLDPQAPDYREDLHHAITQVGTYF